MLFILMAISVLLLGKFVTESFSREAKWDCEYWLSMRSNSPALESQIENAGSLIHRGETHRSGVLEGQSRDPAREIASNCDTRIITIQIKAILRYEFGLTRL